MIRIAFMVQLPREVSPGQRFRCEQYEPLLKGQGYQIETFPFLDGATYKIIYKKGFFVRKVLGVLKGFIRRFLFLFQARRFDFLFVQREMSPIGPPIFEWVAAKVLGLKIIYDFDDAIWIPNVTKGNQLAAFVKCSWKVKWICRWAYKVSAGNDFLAAYGKQYNKRVVLNPTCVDTEKKYNVLSQQHNPPVVGWTGSHSTIQFLALGAAAIRELERTEPFRFVVICDEEPDLGIQSQEFIPWNKATEIEDLAKIDVGIMPLKSDAWSEGKCGFKLIQYMALGIPALASPIGVNKKIIEHGVNGYLCESDEDWVKYLSELLNDAPKRIAFGNRGRQKIVDEFSISSNASIFLSLFTK